MWVLIGRGRFWVGVLAVIALALPFLVSSTFAIDIFIRILLFAFIGVAWNLMGGYAKQLSLGHAAYFGLGAYTSTILLIRYGVSPWIGMLAGGSSLIGDHFQGCAEPAAATLSPTTTWMTLTDRTTRVYRKPD